MLAAAGRELSAAELAALPLADRDAAEEAVLDTGLVFRSGGGLRFRHALLAEAVRADLGEQGRRYEQLALAIEAAAPVAGSGRRGGGRPSAPRGPRRPGRAAVAARRAARPVAGRDAGGGPVLGRGGALRPGGGGPRGWSWPRRSAGSARTPTSSASGRQPCNACRRGRQSVAWNRRGKVLRTVVCNPRASLAAYQQARELLPADAPQPLRVEILLGAAWCESVAGDPARAAALLDEVASLVTDPDDTIVAEMAHAELMSLIRLGRFTECEAVAERGGAAARRAGRPDLAYGIWLMTACALSVAGNLTGALRAADAAVAATRGIHGDRGAVPGRPRVRAVPARPPRRGAVAGRRAAGQGGTDGLPGGRGPGPPRRGADLAGGRALRRGGADARAKRWPRARR